MNGVTKERNIAMRSLHGSMIAASLALVPAATACHFNASNSETSAGSARVGIINSLTGARAVIGQSYQRGYALALEEINAEGGVFGKPLELDIYDDQSKPDLGMQGVSKLVDQDHVPVVIGSGGSEGVLVLVPAMTSKEVPLIVPGATADNIIEQRSPWIFRLCAGSANVAAAVVDFLKNHGAPKTMAVVYENSNFGVSAAVAMGKAAAEGGIVVVDDEAYNAGAQSYSPMLQRVKERKPEVVFFASYVNDATALMRQSRQVGLDARLFTAATGGFSTPEFPTEDKGAGRDAEYTIAASQWVPQPKWLGSIAFDEKFVARYGSHPAYHSMQAYAALKAIRLDTPYGPIHFADNGQNEHPVFFTQVQNGKHAVVWPRDLAVAPVLETPPWSAR